MKKGIIIAGTMLCLTGGALVANGQSYADSTDDRYRANELSLDGYGGLSIGENTFDHLSGNRVRENGRLGLGAGVNYFFTRNFGIGAEGYSEDTQHSFVDNVSGSGILRLPLGQSGVAPYIFGGAGHLFDPRVATEGHGGVGLEFRVNQHLALFTDARYVWTDRVGNYGLGRAGFRFIF